MCGKILPYKCPVWQRPVCSLLPGEPPELSLLLCAPMAGTGTSADLMPEGPSTLYPGVFWLLLSVLQTCNTFSLKDILICLSALNPLTMFPPSLSVLFFTVLPMAWVTVAYSRFTFP